MTSTPVTGSQGSQTVNFVSRSQNGGKTEASPFDALMNSIGDKQSDLSSDVKSEPAVKSRTMSNEDIEYEESAKSEDVSRIEEERPVSTENVSDVKQAVEIIANKIEEELSVTDEDIKRVLEELGFEMTALLSTDLLPQIIARLSGSDDVLSLATDEDLYQSLCEITKTVEEVTDELLVSLDVPKDEFFISLKAVATGEVDTAVLQDENSIGNSEEFAVSNEMGQDKGKTSKVFEKMQLSVNVDKSEEELPATETVQTDFKKSDNDLLRDFAGNRNQYSFMENLLNKVTQAINEVEETVTYTSFDAADIINQITESIKVDVSSEVSEISLRLHPESLGTVSVKISANHEGVLTARFAAQNESVKAVIESQAIVLKETLESKGVTVEAVEVMVQSHEFERNLSDSGRQNTKERNQKKKGLRRIDLSEPVSGDVEADDSLVREMMAQNGNTVDYSA